MEPPQTDQHVAFSKETWTFLANYYHNNTTTRQCSKHNMHYKFAIKNKNTATQY
jgi:hypothetical protein